MTRALDPPEWFARAACRGLPNRDIFFQERGASSADEARAVCHGCTVRLLCLDFAMSEHIVAGIWGGMTYKERMAERRRRLGTRRTAS